MENAIIENEGKPATISAIRNKSVLQFFLLFVLIFLSTLVLCEEDALDLGRYYMQAENDAALSFNEIIENSFRTHIDFIYFLILHIGVVFSIPLNFITSLIVTIYFIIIVKTIRLVYSGKIENIVLFVVLFTTPLTWAVEISRNLTSFLFLYCAIYYFIKRQWVCGILFLLIGVFTHASAMLFLLILLVPYLIRNRRIKPVFLFIVIGGVFIISNIIPDSVKNIMGLLTSSNEDIHYAVYNDIGTNSFFANSSIGYGDKLPVVFALFYSMVLLLCNKTQGFAYWALLVLLVMLMLFVNSNTMLVNRTMMFMPLFWGLNMSIIYRDSPSKKRNIYTLSIIGLIPIVMHFYAYRMVYFHFLF